MMLPDTMYHMFNRGNQKQMIFLQEQNYDYFLEKIGKLFCADASLLAYCLMPNHFHFMALTKSDFDYGAFSSRLRTSLSSYTRGIQIQEKFSGSLFQQNTKRKELAKFSDAINCFHYIHQNPLKAKLVSSMEQWSYSSFNEYLFSQPALCNIELGRSLLELPAAPGLFYQQSQNMLKML